MWQQGEQAKHRIWEILSLEHIPHPLASCIDSETNVFKISHATFPITLIFVCSWNVLSCLSFPFIPLCSHCLSFSPSSALFGQMQRLSFLRTEPPCVLSWLSSCLRGEEMPPFPYLPGICQRTRLLVLVLFQLSFYKFCGDTNVEQYVIRPGNPVLMFRESERCSPYFTCCFLSDTLYRPVDCVVELKGSRSGTVMWGKIKEEAIIYVCVFKWDFPPVPGLSDECTCVSDIGGKRVLVPWMQLDNLLT